MDPFREYHCIHDKVLRDYKNQGIEKNAWQEIAKSLKDVHGINFRNIYPFVYRMEMAHKTDAFSITSEACRESSTPEVCVGYYLGQSFRAIAGMPAA